MSDEQNPVLPEDPSEAEPGRGAPGNNHSGVQLSQSVFGVNPADAVIPSNVDKELNKHQVEAAREQEEGTDLDTTEGYVLDEAGQLNNFAIEPPMYVEEK
ncbi:MAG: hypothetical protein AB1861_29885 [Cyanobacteriota bacterium]